MSEDDSMEEKIRDIIKRAKTNLTQDEAKELMRIWPVMQLQKPQLISKLRSIGLPDAEEAAEKICGLTGGLAVACSGGAITACADELLFRERQSGNTRGKPRKKSAGKETFDELLQKCHRKNPDASARERWRQLVAAINLDNADLLWVEGEGDAEIICIAGRKRSISKKSFHATLSRSKKKYLTGTGCG